MKGVTRLVQASKRSGASLATIEVSSGLALPLAAAAGSTATVGFGQRPRKVSPSKIFWISRASSGPLPETW